MNSQQLLAHQELLTQQITDHKNYADEWYRAFADLQAKDPEKLSREDQVVLDKAIRLCQRNAEHHISKRVYLEMELKALSELSAIEA